MAAAERSGPTPMAFRTWDLLTLPEEQAEPEDSGHAFKIKIHQQGFGGHAGVGEIGGVGEPRGIAAEDHRICKRLLKLSLKRPDIQLAFPGHGGKAGNADEIFGAGAAPQFLAAAMDQRFECQAVTHNKSADAGWATDLVGGNGHHIDAEQTEIDRAFCRRPALHQCAPAHRGPGQGLRLHAAAG